MNLRSSKGINMITLSVAVLILVIITSILVFSSKDSIKIRNIRDLYNDIELLNNKISTYYVQHGDIPKSAKYENLSFLNKASYNQINPNNGDEFYVIDLKAMDGITLNYGRDYDRVSKDIVITSGYEDIYIINEQSHTIYYPRGIDMQGEMYYTYSEEWSEIGETEIPEGISFNANGGSILLPTNGMAKVTTEIYLLSDIENPASHIVEYTVKKMELTGKQDNKI